MHRVGSLEPTTAFDARASVVRHNSGSFGNRLGRRSFVQLVSFLFDLAAQRIGGVLGAFVFPIVLGRVDGLWAVQGAVRRRSAWPGAANAAWRFDGDGAL